MTTQIIPPKSAKRGVKPSSTPATQRMVTRTVELAIVDDINSPQPSQPNRLSTSVRFGRLIPIILPFVLGLFLLVGWTLLTLDKKANFVRSTPSEVMASFIELVQDGSLYRHLLTTLSEVGIGFMLGAGLAFVLGNAIARSKLLDTVLSPYVVGAQAIPIVAIAPILITFVGPGIVTNGLICALIVFFPMLVTTTVGLRRVDPAQRDLLQTYSATRWQTFTRLELPTALPVLLGGIKVSATLAVVGAVVGESVSSEAGLGYLIYQSRYVYNTSRVLVGLFTLTFLAVFLYSCVVLVERRLMAWQRDR